VAPIFPHCDDQKYWNNSKSRVQVNRKEKKSFKNKLTKILNKIQWLILDIDNPVNFNEPSNPNNLNLNNPRCSDDNILEDKLKGWKGDTPHNPNPHNPDYPLRDIFGDW
jgi:hypothetical protein